MLRIQSTVRRHLESSGMGAGKGPGDLGRLAPGPTGPLYFESDNPTQFLDVGGCAYHPICLNIPCRWVSSKHC